MMKILILDGDILFQGIFKKKCEEYGLDACFFTDSNDGMQELDQNPNEYDLVLVAKEFGDKNEAEFTHGLSVLKWIRKNPKLNHMPCILMSTVWGKSDFIEHQRSHYGANGYYQKNQPVKDLEDVIQSVLGRPLNPRPEVSSSQISIQLMSAEAVLGTQKKIPGPIKLETPISLDLNTKSAVTPVAPPVPSTASDTGIEIRFDQSPIEASPEPIEKSQMTASKIEIQIEPTHQISLPAAIDIQTSAAVEPEPTKDIDIQKAASEEVSFSTSAEVDLSYLLDRSVDKLAGQTESATDRGISKKVADLTEKLRLKEAEYELLKERVRMDLRKIRVREKELESRLELVKKDSETLMASRENKILELKRKIDILEFNYDLAVEKIDAEKQKNIQLEQKLEKLSQALKIVQGIAESSSETDLGTDAPGMSSVPSVEDKKVI